jgi:hypothetical protein
MSNQELADEITARFTPYAFTCECEGTHKDCASARKVPSVYIQAETVRRIAEYISQKGE